MPDNDKSPAAVFRNAVGFLRSKYCTDAETHSILDLIESEAAGLHGPDIERHLRRIDSRARLRAQLSRVLAHFKLNTRWPCPECDRPGPDAPLRINTVQTEDGNEYLPGCSRCNADELLADIEAALAPTGEKS